MLAIAANPPQTGACVEEFKGVCKARRPLHGGAAQALA